jgi:hypothetical protein
LIPLVALRKALVILEFGGQPHIFVIEGRTFLGFRRKGVLKGGLAVRVAGICNSVG